jgi:hypothetical protein
MTTKQITLKKGLLIGINYKNSACELGGCINDTENLQNFFISNKYFKGDELVFMNDNKEGELFPTKDNIIKQFENIVKFVNDNPKAKINLFVCYSGHGTRVPDLNRDEKSGLDGAICPVDYSTSGFIIDDYIKEKFINRLRDNVTLIMLVDACHSGTMCDLKYNYICNPTNLCIVDNHPKTRCNIMMISGCDDTQTSADAYIPDKETKINEYQGAMTASFLFNYKEKMSAYDLIIKMRTWLKANGFTQVPQISTGLPMNIKQPFLLEKFKV